jgi:hypothetical protein
MKARSEIEPFIAEMHKNSSSLAGIAAGYWLDDRRVGLRVPVMSRLFTSYVQTGCTARSTSYPVVPLVHFQDIELYGREAE